MADIVGTANNDILNGTDQDDRVWGEAGPDLIQGWDGADTLIGGMGKDTMIGNKGTDLLFGGDDGDVLHGGQQGDVILGEAGHDYVNGNLGDDTVSGNDGDDSVYGGQGNDDVYGNAGDDYLWGNLGRDTLHGGRGDDVLTDTDGVNDLSGDDGNDVLIFGAGVARGGPGSDTYLIKVDAIEGDRALVDNFEAGERLAIQGVPGDTMARVRVFLGNYEQPANNSVNIQFADGKTIDLFMQDAAVARDFAEKLSKIAPSQDENITDVMVPVSEINKLAPTLVVTIIDHDPTAQSAAAEDFADASLPVVDSPALAPVTYDDIDMPQQAVGAPEPLYY